MMSMSFSKALRSIQGIYPDDHVVLNDFIWEFVVVPVSIRGLLLIDGLLLSEVVPVCVLMNFIIFQQHLLRDVVLVDLVWLDIWLSEGVAVIVVIFLPYFDRKLVKFILKKLTYDLGSWV
jgi:hypothetical protein